MFCNALAGRGLRQALAAEIRALISVASVTNSGSLLLVL
jgi:hypothetical protein